jgi:hypothetical protein
MKVSGCIGRRFIVLSQFTAAGWKLASIFDLYAVGTTSAVVHRLSLLNGISPDFFRPLLDVMIAHETRSIALHVVFFKTVDSEGVNSN